MAAAMSSSGEECSDFEDADTGETLSEASQTLPRRKQSSRPSKRRRSRDDSDDSINDFIDDDETENVTRRKRQRRVYTEVDSMVEDLEGPTRRKKSKYKIHIPRDPVLPVTIQYGTQLPSNPDSSPYRIRGAKWKLPKEAAPNRQPSASPNLKENTLLGGEDGAFNRSSSSNLQVTEQEQTPFERDNIHGLPNHNPGPSSIDLAQELADLPSDAFLSSPERSLSPVSRSIDPPSPPKQRPVALQTGFRQTTLFGGRAPVEHTSSQINKVSNYRVDITPEAHTHHKLDQEALNTWVYPTNLGAIRDYQYNIVRNSLFQNTLVALPTGLGKTFIAATIMLNYFRWTREAKIIFMAPTKPLVSQQVDACFNIAGIPRSATTMLTGEISPAIRAEEWEEKRVFFMTPQTLENDLRNKRVGPREIVLLVIDEAHRATGSYAYANVILLIKKDNPSFRVLALTATPGSTVDAVQTVINSLLISKVEIRTEGSMDIQQFTHRLKIDQVILDPSDEIVMIKDLLSKALQPLVDQLCSQNAFFTRDPMALTTYGLVKAKETWSRSDIGRRANEGLRGMMIALFSILSSVAHSIKLLNFHGIGPFYAAVKELRRDVETRGGKPSKYKKQITDSPHFSEMMDRVRDWMSGDGFIGHPKLTYLCDAILNHFLDAGDGRLVDGAPPSGTRVIVFSEFRDSAEEITRVLNRHGPLIRASVFVGQTDSKNSEGMNQAKQQETIHKFKEGTFNVLVATSIGEEGLDIGQVDLIVCYDASGSPIRMLQRMGRTGRKRAGHVILLLMRGKEEESFKKARDGYEHMQKMITSGTHFKYQHEESRRIIPKDITPVVDKKYIEIPFENTQDKSLPEPRRRASRVKKKSPKKFDMPDGVETGFRRASKLVSGDSPEEK
jgi:ATP-dependent DNA helicase MPH1